MAIDFMVMPMSRYISGDFITPAMRFAWTQGVPYTIIGPEGKAELPVNLPFGGADAPARRMQVVEMVIEDLRALAPEVAGDLWDEGSLAEPCFHRVDPGSYEALLAHFEPKAKKGWLGIRKAAPPAHCSASLFLPCEFEQPFAMSSPFERTTGSTGRALKELSSSLPAAAQSAAETLRAALSDSLRLRFPLIVDW